MTHGTRADGWTRQKAETELQDGLADVRCDTCLRRPMLATLIFGGLRISEALALRWRDVDLAGGRRRVAGSKTDAGVRWVPLIPALRDELAERKAGATHTGPNDEVFATRTGGMWSRDNARKPDLRQGGRARRPAA